MRKKHKHSDACDSYWITGECAGYCGEIPIDINGYEFSPNTLSYVVSMNFKHDRFVDNNSTHSIDTKKYHHI